jgi:CRP-like cAMP-binding protein
MELTTKTFQKGQRIVTKGEPADTAYMIDRGRVRVFLNKGEKTVDLAALGEDEIFGETALFQEGAYGAHVEALEDTDVTLITPGILNAKMQKCDPMIRAILQMLIERLRKTNKALVESETREFIDIAFI